ncbi:PadR family transcriptional regulator [Ligilactobacillus sp. WILCCON 0076]|uniref:PadR family transcriptional regulator n=2 Tax=Ligilactobacillus ubinensis TaxID=2876789 RepID=A0A9X2FLV2_9LACO|nr:PadR family transcriptional regulator [Ligilactobacillus ubinensis]
MLSARNFRKTIRLSHANVLKSYKYPIMELRPQSERIFYASYAGERFVLLSHYTKKQSKTDTKQVEHAMTLLEGWFARKQESVLYLTFISFRYILFISKRYKRTVDIEMMNELYVLGELMEKPKTAYRLRQSMQVSLGRHRKTSFGVIYPLFERLEKEGYITLTIQDDDKRSTRLAAITKKGEARFFNLMHEPVPEGAHTDDIFQIKLDSMQHLPLSKQQDLLDQYMNEQVAIVDDCQAELEHLKKHEKKDHWYAMQKMQLRLKQAQVTQQWIQEFKAALKKNGGFQSND